MGRCPNEGKPCFCTGACMRDDRPLGWTPQIRMFTKLPPCVDDKGHKFTVSLYHKDRAVCQRCGHIRKEGK